MVHKVNSAKTLAKKKLGKSAFSQKVQKREVISMTPLLGVAPHIIEKINGRHGKKVKKAKK